MDHPFNCNGAYRVSDTTPSPKKDFSLTRSAIQTIAVGIKAQYKEEGKAVPEGRELLRLAAERYRSSIENGQDNFLGTAAPLT